MQDRELAAFTEIEHKNEKDFPLHRYQRKLIYKYTTRKVVVNNDMPEMGPSISTVEETKFYRVTEDIKIIGDKTFYEFNDEKKGFQHIKKPRAKLCIDLEYKPEDFAKGLSANHTKINKKTWDAKSGVSNKINEMQTRYQRELVARDITFGGVHAIDVPGIKYQYARLLNFYNHNHHFYNHTHRIIAKWIFWSAMKIEYQKALNDFKQNHRNFPINFNLHQECYRKVMSAMTEHLGPKIVKDITAGGSFFGKNDTVRALQDMGVMGDDKYTSGMGLASQLFTGSRYCLFSGKPTISPSNKELMLRSGGDPDVWEAEGKPPAGSTLISSPKIR